MDMFLKVLLFLVYPYLLQNVGASPAGIGQTKERSFISLFKHYSFRQIIHAFFAIYYK